MSSTKITMHDIDESVKEALSPIEHIENKENPHEVTAEQVGAADAENHNMKTYTSLEQIGITVGSETIDSIMEALPINSMLMFHVTSSNNTSQYPISTATCIVYKSMDSRTSLTLEAASTGRRWFAEHYNTGTEITWTGWKEIFTTESGTLIGNISISDGYTRITGDASQTQINALNVKQDTSNRRILAIRNSSNQPALASAFQVMDVINNSVTPYRIYGEHNITRGTTDIGAGSALATGCIHLVYE